MNDKDVYERIADDIERVAKNYGKNSRVVRRDTYKRQGKFSYGFVKRAFEGWSAAVEESEVYTQSTWSDSEKRMHEYLLDIYEEHGSLSHSVLEDESYASTSTILKKHGEDDETWSEYKKRVGLPQ